MREKLEREIRRTDAINEIYKIEEKVRDDKREYAARALYFIQKFKEAPTAFFLDEKDYEGMRAYAKTKTVRRVLDLVATIQFQ